MLGIAVGTPQVGHEGRNVYTSHNAKSHANASYNRGLVSAIEHGSSGVAQEIPLEGLSMDVAAFGPLAVTVVNEGDVLVWGTIPDEEATNGTTNGTLYKFDGTSIVNVGVTNGTSLGAPVLSGNGNSLWAVTSAAVLQCWIGNHSSGQRPTWTAQLDTSHSGLDFDETSVYAITASGPASLNASTGDFQWIANVSGLQPTLLRLTDDAMYVFAAEVGKRVSAFSAGQSY